MRQELTLSDHDARIAVEVIRAETEKRGKSAVIAVVDSRGELISLLRMDGAAFSSVNVATNKAFTAARLKRPSSVIGRNARHPETGFNISYYSDPRFIGFSGGLPVIIDGQTVITGSFNFTKSAETGNAENVLLILHAPELAKRYSENWQEHLAHSQKY